MTLHPETPATSPLQEKVYRVIFEADTPAGKLFDVALLLAILVSVLVVLMDSVESFEQRHGATLRLIEWVITGLFAVEYLLRLYCVRRAWRYARSFFGIVDLVSILPTFLSLIVVGSQHLLVIRVLRLLRVFRVFKLVRFLGEANVLMSALRASLPKITVFLGSVLSIVVIMGTVMYLVEGAEHGFTSIPQSMYWAIVTMTTVGYGDVAPQTSLGKILASGLMILGYAIIAVPTGIVSAELVSASPPRRITTRTCPECLLVGHDREARHCKRCGAPLHSAASPETQTEETSTSSSGSTIGSDSDRT